MEQIIINKENCQNTHIFRKSHDENYETHDSGYNAIASSPCSLESESSVMIRNSVTILS